MPPSTCAGRRRLPLRWREAGETLDWGRVARVYDWQLPLERAALAVALELVEPRQDDVVLDLGTGTGAVLRALARRRDRPATAVGVDDSPAMLRRAPSLPHGWSLQRADARRLPFADGRFSAVVAAYLLHVVDPPARRQIVGECRRVLCPGGRLAVVTPAWPRTRVARMLYAPLAAAGGRSAGPAAGFRPLDPRQELEEAGFRIRAVRHVSRGYPSICVSAAR